MTEQEFKTGVMADGTRLMQPPMNYILEALVTLSPSWHGDKVAKHNFVHAMNEAIGAANQLDKIKKTLFYGKDNNLQPRDGQAGIGDLPALFGDNQTKFANIIHAIIGIFTESGELLEALKDGYNGKPFDFVNAKEETGDLFWYMAILAHECGFTFEQAQETNIAKLRARFPNKFDEFDANNRNLAGERLILEQTNPASGPEAVAAVQAKADAAFEKSTPAKPVIVGNVDLSKPIGERETPLPGEHISRQPTRESEA